MGRLATYSGCGWRLQDHNDSLARVRFNTLSCTCNAQYNYLYMHNYIIRQRQREESRANFAYVLRAYHKVCFNLLKDPNALQFEQKILLSLFGNRALYLITKFETGMATVN